MKPFASSYAVAKWAEGQTVAGPFSVLTCPGKTVGRNNTYDSAKVPVDCFGNVKEWITYRGN